MKLIRLILRRPTSVILMILAVVVFGSASLTGMPLEYMPDMEMPMELVMVTWPGADADSIDRLVTQPIEDECETLSDIDSVNSYSFDNYAMLQLTYKYGVDMDEVYSDLKNSMDNLMPTLPEDCEDPLIMELSADFMPTMILSAVAPEGMDAASYLNDTVVPVIESLGGVAQVEVTGAQDEYLRIVLDEAALQQYRLSISAVGSAIAAADFDMPVGDVTLGTQDIALGVYGSVDVNADFRNLPIQTPSGQMVALGDLCTFFNVYEKDAENLSRYNGGDSVMLSVTKQDSAATVEVCEDVMEILDRYSVDGLSFEVIYNEADSIMETLGEVLNTLITGIILTMLVLFLFFGDLRASLIVGNIPADYAVPQYYEITSSTVTEESAVLHVAGSNDTITVPASAKLTPYLTKNIVTLADLRPGARILVWSDSKGTPEKVLVFAYGYRGYISVAEDGVVSVNGQSTTQKAKTTADGDTLLPIRAVAEALGMSPVTFGIMLTMNLAIGFCTPPYGIDLFVASAISGVSIGKMMKFMLWFIFSLLVVLMLVTYWPAFTMFALA